MGRLPNRRKKSAAGQSASDRDLANEAKFHRCPGGHSLPHHTNKGQCTPLYCTGAKSGDLATATPSKPAPSAASDDGDDRAKEEARLNRAQIRAELRKQALNVPAGLKGGDAEAWTAQKLVELSPFAAAEMEYQLMYGDDEQRSRAAARVLDSTGHGKKDLATGGATIIINATGGVNLPWRAAKAIEGTVVETRPIGTLEQGQKEPKKS